MKNVKSRNTPGKKEAQKKSALEQSNTKLKRIIATLSVALVACLVYIFAYPTPSTPPQNTMNRSYPAAEPTAAPPSAQVEVEALTDAPAADPQRPASDAPAVAPNTTTTMPSEQRAGKINPPHGEPGHRCDVPVGSPLP
ncbi:MAG: hypothetical protein KFH87_07585 [Bacteroidetes bacterium]|nr:hypothetical protein [Bacteroidota bacterium]